MRLILFNRLRSFTTHLRMPAGVSADRPQTPGSAETAGGRRLGVARVGAGEGPGLRERVARRASYQVSAKVRWGLTPDCGNARVGAATLASGADASRAVVWRERVRPGRVLLGIGVARASAGPCVHEGGIQC